MDNRIFVVGVEVVMTNDALVIVFVIVGVDRAFDHTNIDVVAVCDCVVADILSSGYETVDGMVAGMVGIGRHVRERIGWFEGWMRRIVFC